jgi:uncharacterized protein YbbK (DUF523 family)
VLVSACLLGVACNHKGAASPSAAVQAMAATHRLIGVCPETLGGLPTPRAAAEIQADERVVNADGTDVTAAYRRGAAATVELAERVGAVEAVLKARSPSCGCGEVYDGTFGRTLRPGDGVTTAALKTAGIAVRTEESVSA